MNIYFDISEERINSMSIEDYEAFERAQDGEIKLYRLRPAICRFMVDENHKPIPYKEALKITSEFDIKHFNDFITQFFTVMQEKAVPKSNGKSSTLPLPVKQEEVFPSPDGA